MRNRDYSEHVASLKKRMPPRAFAAYVTQLEERKRAAISKRRREATEASMAKYREMRRKRGWTDSNPLPDVIEKFEH